MVKKWQWIFDGIKNIDEVKPIGFLLDRKNKQFDSYKLHRIKTDYFRMKVKSILEKLKEDYESNTVQIKNFPQEITEERVVHIVDIKEFQSIRETINKIYLTDQARKIDDLKLLSGLKFSAMYFKIQDEKSIITIDDVTILNMGKVDKKIGLVASYDKSGLREFDGNAILAFKIGSACIYFEEKKKLVVFDMNKTQNMFPFLEHYKDLARQHFDNISSYVKIKSDVLEKGINNMNNATRIYRIIKNDTFDRGIEYYVDCKKIITQRKLNDDLTKLLIIDDKVIINDIDHFKSFLHMTDNNILQPIADTSQTYIAFSKRKAKTVYDDI